MISYFPFIRLFMETTSTGQSLTCKSCVFFVTFHLCVLELSYCRIWCPISWQHKAKFGNAKVGQGRGNW